MRPSIKKAKSIFKNNPVNVAEVGVEVGGNAVNILKNFNINKLYLIDIWENKEKYKKAKDKLKPYEEKIICLKKSSEEAHKDIPDNSLHFVYIDGDHTSPVVDKDLRNYYKKVIKGGMFCGHDYGKNAKDVIKAVDKWISETGYELNVNGIDWWVYV